MIADNLWCWQIFYFSGDFFFYPIFTDNEEYANEVYKALEKFKAKYNQIAIYFGLPPSKVEEIRGNHPGDNASVLNDVIVSWVRQEYDVRKFGYPCWRKVVEAAIGAEIKLQAKKIAESHPGEYMYTVRSSV